MKFIDRHVTSLVNGEELPAEFAACDDCDGQVFYIFVIDGNHQHLQCVECGVIYCDGSCGKLKANVRCDLCNKDFTNSPATGGIYGLGTKGICPECAPRVLEECERTGELEFVTARCPEGKAFADWIREVIR
jgi:hypothetical protein